MKTNYKSEIWPDAAIPPGELLAETIDALGLTQKELAIRMDRPIQVVNEIIRGKKAITPATAIEFERVLGTPAHVWLNLERDYQFIKARLSDIKKLEAQVSRVDDFPYREMAKHGWIRNVRDKVEQARELLAFFGIMSFDELPNFWEAAYRRSYKRKPSPESLAAWLRRGESEARGIDIGAFDEKKLKSRLDTFRALTRKSAKDFSKDLQRFCAGCGVAVVFVPHLPKTYANGAVRWLRSGAALVQLSVRYKYDDIFWFSFFHELGHIILHGKNRTFIEIDERTRPKEEYEADEFARDTLIPPDQFEVFRSRQPFSRRKVESFAETIGVAPSIVVGRLQYENLLQRSHLNGLRTQLDIKHSA